MNTNQEWKISKAVWLTVILYAGICECISLAVLGRDPGFFIGLAIGTVVLMINFRILGSAVRTYFTGGISFAGFLYVLRLAIYFAGGVACAMISTHSIIAYGIAVLGIIPGVAVLVLREQRK